MSKGNKLIPPEEFFKFVIKTMRETEDAHKLPRGTLICAMIDSWNKRIDGEKRSKVR